MGDIIRLDLQLFAEGDGGTAGGEAATESQTGVQQADAAPEAPTPKPRAGRRENPLANVRYGRQPGETPAEQPETGTASEGEDRAARWAELKKEFADEYGTDVQNVIRERFKNQSDASAQLEAIRPMLTMMAQQMGVADPNDLQAISSAYMNDDRLYEEEAESRGLPIETVKQLHQLQADSDTLRQIQEQSATRQMMEAHLQKLIRQGEELKQKFPGFDLRTELNNNREFAKLTSPGVGMSVEQAFYACHYREMQPMAAALGAQVAEKRLSNAIAAGQRHPSENGTSRGSSVETKADPTKFTRADREEIRRRVARGEKIYF